MIKFIAWEDATHTMSGTEKFSLEVLLGPKSISVSRLLLQCWAQREQNDLSPKQVARKVFEVGCMQPCKNLDSSCRPK